MTSFHLLAHSGTCHYTYSNPPLTYFFSLCRMYSVRVVLLLYSFLALGLGTLDLPKEDEKIEEESGGIEIQVSLTEGRDV